MSVYLALTWILFIGLFPISFIWLRRAWKTILLKDYSEVAMKAGLAPPNAAKYAPFSAAINIIGGGILLSIIVLVIVAAVKYETWTAIVGSTIWMKLFAEFILSRHAHPIRGRKVK